MFNENGLLDDFSKDGVHMNAYGYQAWSDEISILVNGKDWLTIFRKGRNKDRQRSF